MKLSPAVIRLKVCRLNAAFVSILGFVDLSKKAKVVRDGSRNGLDYNAAWSATGDNTFVAINVAKY